jgi:hypothetical protein
MIHVFQVQPLLFMEDTYIMHHIAAIIAILNCKNKNILLIFLLKLCKKNKNKKRVAVI